MDRGAWWSTVHGATKKSEMIEWWNNKLKSLVKSPWDSVWKSIQKWSDPCKHDYGSLSVTPCAPLLPTGSPLRLSQSSKMNPMCMTLVSQKRLLCKNLEAAWSWEESSGGLQGSREPATWWVLAPHSQCLAQMPSARTLSPCHWTGTHMPLAKGTSDQGLGQLALWQQHGGHSMTLFSLSHQGEVAKLPGRHMSRSMAGPASHHLLNHSQPLSSYI